MKKTVLLADAESQIDRELRAKLLAQGYQVLCTGSLKQALAGFDMRLIDVVLLDLDAPAQDGWSALARLTPAPRLIALTERSEIAEMAARARLSAVAEKPIQVTNLLGIIEEMLTQTPDTTRFHYVRRATATFRQEVHHRAAARALRPAANSGWGINE